MGHRRRFDDIDRARPDGYLNYMLKRPFYFKSLSGMEATTPNIREFHSYLKSKGLVVNPNPPKPKQFSNTGMTVCEEWSSAGLGGTR